jgi:hypothetical protein
MTPPAVASASRHWSRRPTEQLLDLRFKDLALSIDGTWVAQCVARLYEELARTGLTLRPHVWLSEEWFSPSGVPGVAIPFYLVHPRLVRLERQLMFEAEGATREGCMRLLREIQAISRRCYRALELEGYARLDFRLRDDGALFLLEANPNPDISRDAEFASSALEAGYPYEALIQKLLSLGVAREPGRLA